MKALGILGTASSVGKSWVTTALGAWLRRQGVRVAPFKAQNMSNNAWVTWDDREIARAQAAQALACGLEPTVAMNPILLKPSGEMGVQLVIRGEQQGHRRAQAYYADRARLWRIVEEELAGWQQRCEVLLLEGAGSPVELNLAAHDLVNLRPLRHVDGRWLLVGDIDRGGIFAQLAGTWQLLSAEDRARGLGAIINRFRGDRALFSDPAAWLAPHAPGLPVLGTVPLRPDLQPDEEDGLDGRDVDRGVGEVLAWVRLPHAAILNDCQPWWDDAGVRVRWTDDPQVLGAARAIVIPGSRNTIADLRWLRASGMGQALQAAAARGVLIVGLCGGYQLLGESLADPAGVAGDAGTEAGLGLLPLHTEFRAPKIVRRVTTCAGARRFPTYEIRMGRSTPTAEAAPLQEIIAPPGGTPEPEGLCRGNVWGTYQHDWFAVPETRLRVTRAAGLTAHRAYPEPWAEKRRRVYDQMAEHLAAHLDLDPVRRYLGL